MRATSFAVLALSIAAGVAGSCGGGGQASITAGDAPTSTASTRADRAAAERAPRHPPIVMLVFDEFSTISLLDAHGRIDPVRYPNFAALAGDSTWFPFATASSDDTGRAMRSMFTGRTLWRYAKPTWSDEPRNLFTLLGRRYRMNVSEESTSMCPPRLCPASRTKSAHEVLHKLGSGRPERFLRWLRSVRPASRPTLFFKHVLLPHAPWTYLPSGRRYPKGASERGLSWDLWHYNRWLVNQDYQRHLLQVEFTDRLLGRALAHLRRTGLYDRALIVVTADNGESFGRLGNGHNFNHRNAAEIALTPLIVKLPFQHRGRIDSRHVRIVDVLPTIASVAHVRPGWRLDGRPLVGPDRRRPPASVLLFERDGRRIVLPGRELRRRTAAALRLKLRLFGSGDRGPGLFGIGPRPSMHRTAVARWPMLPAGHTRAVLDPPGSDLEVRAGASSVPVKVSGRLIGPAARRPTDVAVAIDGTIVATAPTVGPDPNVRRVISVLVPESALRMGHNRLEVFAIERRQRLVALRPLTAAVRAAR
jgi:Sulfatase